MSLLPSTASFHELVQDCFAAFRGRGLMLSALDVELVDRWEKTEVPFEVIARGIRRAAEQIAWDTAEGEPGLRSLAACRREVEREITKFTASSIGRGTEGKRVTKPVHLLRHAKLVKMLRALGDEHPALAARAETMATRLLPPVDYLQSTRQEEWVLAGLLRALEWNQRLTLLQQATRLMQKNPAHSSRARVEAKRFHRAALLRRHLSIKSSW